MPLEDDPGLAAGWLLCSFVLRCFIWFETADVMEGLTSTKCLHSQTFCCQVFAPYYHQSTLHRGVRSLRAS